VQEEDHYYDQPGGTTRRIALFRGLGASPSAGTITISTPATTLGCAWIVDQFTGVSTSGTNGSGAIGQKALSTEPSGAAATTVTATLAGAITAGNVITMGGGWEANEAPAGVGGWTQLAAVGHNAPTNALVSAWNNSDADNSGTLSWTTSTPHGLIVVEIVAGAIGATGTIGTGSATASGQNQTGTAGGTGTINTGSATAGGLPQTAGVGDTGTINTGSATAGGLLQTATAGMGGVIDTGVATAGGEAQTATAGAAGSVTTGLATAAGAAQEVFDIPFVVAAVFAVGERYHASLHSQLVVTGPGGTSPIQLPIREPAITWAVGNIPLLSGFITVDEFIQSGFDPLDAVGWMNKELYFEHTHLGRWSGLLQVVNRQQDRVEIVGEGWVSRLRTRTTVPIYHPVSGPGGLLAYRLLIDSATDDSHGFTSIEVDADGPILSAEWRSDNLYQALRRLCDESGLTFWCSEDQELTVRRRIGQDLTGSVRLAYGLQITSLRAAVDRTTVINDLTGVSEDGNFEQSSRVQVEDLASVYTYGRNQAVAQYPGTTRGSIEWRARSDLANFTHPSTPAEITVSNTDDCWASFREGDVVRVAAPVLGDDQAFEIYTRTWQPSTNELVCVGNLLSLEDLA
jgi:hypothetical protein